VRINFLDDSGRPKQFTRIAYGSDVAKTLEMKLINEIKTKCEIPTKKITIQELFNEYVEVKKYELRESSIIRMKQAYVLYILPTYKDYRIDKLTVNDIQKWKISMEIRNLSLSTKKIAFTYFSTMINYAIKMGYLNDNPLSKVGSFKNILGIKPKIDFYTQEEFNKFIISAKEIATEREKQFNDVSEWNYYVFFNIAFYTGLRKGEIHALKWSDIDGSYLMVSRSISQRNLKNGDFEGVPKSNSSIRTLQMPLPLIEVLTKQKQRQQLLHNFDDDFRICGSIRDNTLRIRKSVYSSKARIKNIRTHDFRHSHATILANNNINIQEVARRLGHARIELTWNTYCHLYPKEEEKAIAVFNSFN